MLYSIMNGQKEAKPILYKKFQTDNLLQCIAMGNKVIATFLNFLHFQQCKSVDVEKKTVKLRKSCQYQKILDSLTCLG